MKVNFTYSFKKEIIEAINMVLHFHDYQNLRSVIWPSPLNLLSSTSSKDKAIKKVEKIWKKIGPQVEKTFKKFHLKDIGNVTCYLHAISCEGWFDVDDNSIHVRTTNYGNTKNLVDTIIHELLHLATYGEKLNYDEREAIIDNFLVKPEFKNLTETFS